MFESRSQRPLGRSFLTSLCYVADECNVVAFDDDAAYFSSGPFLPVHFGGLVEHHVHELVEADDFALDAQVRVLVQPHFHARLRLEELEDQELHTEQSQGVRPTQRNGV